MSKKEGEILKKAIDEAGYTQEKFSELMGYSTPSGLKYYFDKERVREDVKEKAAAILGTTADALFDDEKVKKFGSLDKENKLMADLIETQKSLIQMQERKQTDGFYLTINRVLNTEAYLQVVLRRICELQAFLSKETDKNRLLGQSEKEVREIFEGLSSQLTG